MPTVAAGGGNILNFDFFCCPSDDEEDEEGEQGEKNIPKQGKASSVLADTQAELEAFPCLGISFGRHAGRTGGAKCNSLLWQGEWQGECG